MNIELVDAIEPRQLAGLCFHSVVLGIFLYSLSAQYIRD